jgi:hypothetical protein
MFDSVGWFKQLELLTYSIYFSYAIFLTDYKKILKIAGGVKQLTVPQLSNHIHAHNHKSTEDDNVSIPYH